MKKFYSVFAIVLIPVLTIFSTCSFAQNDTLYIMKNGNVRGKYKTAEIDSIVFYKPTTSTFPINITYVTIPTGTFTITYTILPFGIFTMGSPKGEPGRYPDETLHQVSLSAYGISKYEITNAQYAEFLNAKSIGSDGKYATGAYPTEVLIYASVGDFDFGLHYTDNQWIPVAGYENNPVIFVSWYGATEFATYVGGTLPTEAQWEYACRAGTATAFNTGTCLSDAQANYHWGYPQTNCSNTNKTLPNKTQVVGTYPANAFGLHDMHGNVMEWCSDWWDYYSGEAQTDPTGAASGTGRIVRGGNWSDRARYCRSANRIYGISPSFHIETLGFRVVYIP